MAYPTKRVEWPREHYCRLAQWRTTDPKQRAKAARVEAVEPVSDDQPDLFEVTA